MRQPTSDHDAWRFWRECLAAPVPALRPRPNPDNPQCGFWMLRSGPTFWPVIIWIEREIDRETGELLSDEVLRCHVGTREADPVETWSWCAKHPITPERHQALLKEIKGMAA